MNKKIVKFLSLFIFNKKQRHYFRGKYLNKCLNKKLLNKYREEIKCIQPVIIGNDKNSDKILHISTFKTQCGIATFTDDLISGFQENGYNSQSVFPINYNYLLNSVLIKEYLYKIVEVSKEFDTIIIQNEYALWSSHYFYHNISLLTALDKIYDNYIYTPITISLLLLDYLFKELISLNKKIIVVWHADFDLSLKPFYKYNQKHIVNTEQIPCYRFFNNENIKIISLNKNMANVLSKYNIPTNKIEYIRLPLKEYKFDSKKISERYIKNYNEITLGGFGFLAESKGIFTAIKLLTYLPEYYKYLHVGGCNDINNEFYQKLISYIEENNLKDRVTITGFLPIDVARETAYNIDLGLYLCKNKTLYSSSSINLLLLNQIPTITSSNANFKELAADYDCVEVLYDIEDLPVIAKKITELYANKKRMSQLQNNCKIFSKENTYVSFSLKIIH